MNITLKEIPTDLHKRLKERAEVNGRSLNKELMTILEQAVYSSRVDAESLRASVRERRAQYPNVVGSAAEIKKMIEDGRE